MAADQQRTITMPQYLARFQCLGAACESNCCAAGWEVPVDLESFDRFQHMADPELGAEIRQHLVQVEADGAHLERTRLQLRESDRACHFLTSDRLCGMQLRGGGDILCLTCATYPRVSSVVDGVIQRAAKLSCPETARLALLEPNGMRLTQRQERASREVVAAEVTTSTAGAGDPMAFFPLIRGLAVDMLRRREVSIEARLAALGVAFRKLSEAIGQQTWEDEARNRRLRASRGLHEEDVRDAFESARWRLKELHHHLAYAPAAHALEVEVLGALQPERFFQAGVITGYTDWVVRMQAALRHDHDDLLEQRSVKIYRAADRRWYVPYMAKRPHVIENLLINHIYASAFPFTPETSLCDEYMTLAAHYVSTRIHLVAAAAAAGGLTDKLLVEIVHLLARAIDHTTPYREHLIDLIRVRDLTPVRIPLAGEGWTGTGVPATLHPSS